jgi:hypothetical protein
MSWVWWYTSVIPALGRLRQENHEFQGSLGYIARPYVKKKCMCEDNHLTQQEGESEETKSANTLISDFSARNCEKINCFKSVSQLHFVRAVLRN